MNKQMKLTSRTIPATLIAIFGRLTTLAERAPTASVKIDLPGYPQVTGELFLERRSVPRYNLIAEIEVFDPLRGIKLRACISEIGAKGCYVCMATPLFKKTTVQLLIPRGPKSFRSWGEVVYTQEEVGMGINFFRTEANQVKTLGGWISDLDVQQPHDSEPNSP